jgi:NADH:ubiquinone oxidoreductase subunit 3 (subunit A)
MIESILLSPPVALLVFMGLAYGLYLLGGKLAAPGKEQWGKNLPYACGEDLLPPETQLTYQAFFRLALFFGVLHLATLVVATLPPAVGISTSHRIAAAYLMGIGISVFVLTQREL